jgi:hypothetical protein
MREKSFARYSSNRGLIFRIFKVLKTLNTKNINNSTNKWENRQLSKEVQAKCSGPSL